MSRLTQTTFLFYCKPENEQSLAHELNTKMTHWGWAGYSQPLQGQGLCRYIGQGITGGTTAVQSPKLDDLVFASQILTDVTVVEQLPDQDRISRLLPMIAGLLPDKRYQSFYIEYPDHNEGRSLSRFSKKFSGALANALRTSGFVKVGSPEVPHLHIFFHSYQHCEIGLSWAGNRCRWPMGIARLKFPEQSPSRSYLKLEEAIKEFYLPLGGLQVADGKQAVDMGAAPGGWSFNLLRHNMQVTAIDNGSMHPDLFATGRLTHHRADAFHFQPSQPIDLLVCDMVEKPDLVNQLLLRWYDLKWCQDLIFNLKLPMKKKFPTVEKALEPWLSRQPKKLVAKQLYHNRDEVSVIIIR